MPLCRPLSSVVLLLLAACASDPAALDTAEGLAADGLTTAPPDGDGDGWHSGEDCDDADASVHPLQSEVCGDGVDNNCDGRADEGCPAPDAAEDTGDTGDVGEDTGAPVEDDPADLSGFAVGDLLITELMINPEALRDPEGEWVEVLNLTERSLDLRGLTLEASGQAVTLEASVWVAAGAAVVLGPGQIPSLLNEGATLRLLADGRLLDAVTWTQDAVPGGASWSLDPLVWGVAGVGENDQAAWWCAGAARWGERTDLGSPGALNPGCPAYDHDGDGYSRDEGDCDDADAARSPGAVEVWYDGTDQDCDGASDFDQDGDGFDVPEDCDDRTVEVSPAAVEVCNGVDDDCDGTTDAEAVDGSWWYADADGDGYGEEGGVPVWACAAPSGMVADATDCDDSDDGVMPGGVEVCGDEVDEDCDGGASVCDEVAYAVGGDASSWLVSRYYRGNLYAASADGTLLRFAVRLDLPATGCDVDMYVFSASSTAGPWTLEWMDTVRGAGSGYISTGAIELETVSGRVYGLGTGWSCKATYYGEYGSFLGDDGGIGGFTGTHYDNAYSSGGTSYTPAYTGAGSVAYDQIVYMDE